MKRIRLGVFFSDREYGDRFAACLMNHYRQQLELHIFSEPDALWEEELDAVLLEGHVAQGKRRYPIFCLYDEETDAVPLEEEGDVYWVEKYQEVNRIVDEMMQRIGEEIRGVQQSGSVPAKESILAVYSLSGNEYQLPLAVTLASILSEKERVLLLDLQENSGLSQLGDMEAGSGLEELLVMAESGKFAPGRMISCIGHLDRADYVYPVGNSECLCEASGATYQRLIHMVAQEVGYSTVILNLGSRFIGFFELLESCREVYLLKGRGGLGQWRQREFVEELEKHGMSQLSERLREIELPVLTTPAITCERLVEQWKWNDFGDSIRRMVPEVASCG